MEAKAAVDSASTASVQFGHISGGVLIAVANGGIVASSFCSKLYVVALVADDKHVFLPTTTAGHARVLPRDASAAPWYASCRFRRPLELPFTPRSACHEVTEVDSDAEEALRAEEERGLY